MPTHMFYDLHFWYNESSLRSGGYIGYSMFKDNSGKIQEISPLDETRGDQIYVCVFLMTL